MNNNHQFFSSQLLSWNRDSNQRTMPWKGEKDPYKIWLSEIMLQQTRVEQGRAYYEAFTSKYPTVFDLAAAPDEEVFRLWQGLGYYARCKNMLAAARSIVHDYNGIFPNDYHTITTLKGIGSYTAAAIASFAFNLPYAVLDGNVYRVLARFFGIDTPIDTTAGKKIFSETAQNLLPVNKPAVYNQAIMDFGAVVCKPQQPNCLECPLATKCIAFLTNQVNKLPLKSKKLTVKNRYFFYIVAIYNQQVLIQKRPGKDIWQNLHEFIPVESPEILPAQTILEQSREIVGTVVNGSFTLSPLFKQKLTHQTIHAQFIRLALKSRIQAPQGFQWVPLNSLDNYAFPKIILDYLQNNQLQLL